MSLLDLPDEIFNIILNFIIKSNDFNSFRICFMALKPYFTFDTSNIKQKILEIEFDDINIGKNNIYLFNGYCINNNLNNPYSEYDIYYLDKEIVGINYFADLHKNNITYSLFKINYSNDLVIYITNNELSSKYINYIQDYDIIYTKNVPIRYVKPNILKIYSTSLTHLIKKYILSE